MTFEKNKTKSLPPGAYTLLGKIAGCTDSSVVSKKASEPGNLHKRLHGGVRNYL